MLSDTLMEYPMQGDVYELMRQSKEKQYVIITMNNLVNIDIYLHIRNIDNYGCL